MAALAPPSPPPQSPLSVAEVQFTNAFNSHRTVLAGFAKASSRSELHQVRDGFFLGMASELCKEEYEPVKVAVIQSAAAAAAAGTASSFETVVEEARRSEGWMMMVESVRNKAAFVGTDLEAIWMGLETGRLEWLAAASASHGIKTTLRAAVEKGGGGEGEESDAKMVWMYSLALSIPAMQLEAASWATAVGMSDKTAPLEGYDRDKWDSRRAAWRPLDVGVQEAAERGGEAIEEAWLL